MRVGITVDNPDTVVAEARRAEELGFDILGCGEHLFFHGPTPNSFAMLAAAAAVTSRIRLVTSIALLPLYPAVAVAKMASVIDRISGGRFELGVGAGGEYPAEFAAAGVDPATRFHRLDEGLEVIRRLFAGGRVDFEGSYATLSGVALDPAPHQPEGPPIWLGGRKNGALRRAGRHAQVWLPYMVEPKHVGEGLATIRAAAAEHERDADAVSAALFAWTAVDADSTWARTTGVAAVSAAYSQDFSTLADRYLLIGTPEAVIDRLARFAAAGVDTVLIQIAAGSVEHRSRIIETFASRVLPGVRVL
ncbi:LLM class flavin-dependent oxidoreductase [Mycobacterium sp. Aquia_216]|uniref:LLM class flavin-dependent oxidoreductase n=1 Tax=Mycobacterium sp. Aquia_216 TaxID=2991729 RepID=UPI00227BC468|nr:LLM class flavin-dependent oxidoreductase [Mycobacterium sp. Aquia_216]WAJ47783.1 LLM class flavin-dependent oxidoreductase [Mycobacterium sp. Aquia_216]